MLRYIHPPQPHVCLSFTAELLRSFLVGTVVQDVPCATRESALNHCWSFLSAEGFAFSDVGRTSSSSHAATDDVKAFSQFLKVEVVCTRRYWWRENTSSVQRFHTYQLGPPRERRESDDTTRVINPVQLRKIRRIISVSPLHFITEGIVYSMLVIRDAKAPPATTMMCSGNAAADVLCAVWGCSV